MQEGKKHLTLFEAVSIAHTQGRPIVGAESFTGVEDGWRKYPGAMKLQGDWGLCAGINPQTPDLK